MQADEKSAVDGVVKNVSAILESMRAAVLRLDRSHSLALEALREIARSDCGCGDDCLTTGLPTVDWCHSCLARHALERIELLAAREGGA